VHVTHNNSKSRRGREASGAADHVAAYVPGRVRKIKKQKDRIQKRNDESESRRSGASSRASSAKRAPPSSWSLPANHSQFQPASTDSFHTHSHHHPSSSHSESPILKGDSTRDGKRWPEPIHNCNLDSVSENSDQTSAPMRRTAVLSPACL